MCIRDRVNAQIVFAENYIDLEPLIGPTTAVDAIVVTNIPFSAAAFHLSDTDYYVYIPPSMVGKFRENFGCWLTEGSRELTYDNLINLCIMVKNAGPQFESMLERNMHLADRWTILDTGSTDETLDIIHRVIGRSNKPLQLVIKDYGEDFNFKDSRNYCLDLASAPENRCKFNVMLDDTYIMQGDLRRFLNVVRGDQYGDSYSTYIRSNDNHYTTNRITKAGQGLRYMFRIHEVITDKDNINVIVPDEVASILDERFDYMEERTNNRKALDLKLLYQDLEENPNEPRTYYYLAQTYKCIGDMEKTLFYYLKRAEFLNAGFIQERVDALCEAGRTAEHQLKMPWAYCKDLYEKAYKADESRPDSLFFTGLHYIINPNEEDARFHAYNYMRRGFALGYPIHAQYGLKPTLSFRFLPYHLTGLCYEFDDFALGLAAAERYLTNNEPQTPEYAEVASWYAIYKKIVDGGNNSGGTVIEPVKPLFVFVADGGFAPWTGRDILSKGVGGSETHVIEMARYIQQSKHFDVVVFCNTPAEQKEDVFEGVQYKPLTEFAAFIQSTHVMHCCISRFSEYIPLAIRGQTEHIYLVVHDVTPSGIVIPMHPKLKRILCLTEWHAEYLKQIFPQLAPIITHHYYGVDFERFLNPSAEAKVAHRFIYSSFPNRGLHQLLQMWPRILDEVPDAELHIYADVDGAWVNSVAPVEMEKIRGLLKVAEMTDQHIVYHGWVDKQTLASAWLSSDVWFYPCTFKETFCLTALEAAITRTLVITNDLAALQNTVGDRGFIIPGDAATEEWQQLAIKGVAAILKDKAQRDTLVERNHQWAAGMSWKEQAIKFLRQHVLPNNKEYRDIVNPYLKPSIELTQYYISGYVRMGGYDPLTFLEVGTHTGCTLARFLQAVPHSRGIGVDVWAKPEVRQSFLRNMATEKLVGRVQAVQDDSSHFLSASALNGDKVDLVIVDGEETDMQRLNDLVQAWAILRPGGYLITPTVYYVNVRNTRNQAIDRFYGKIMAQCSMTNVDGMVTFLKK
jgi:glycosyltransferase involved in cell wall biosynthesis/tetratricopeptide (TPR) repeat protein/predicted O-methyltransferase YrrM